MQHDGRAYLDAAQVAPPLAAAREAYLAALDDGWADPRRLHREARRARMLLDGAREAVAVVLGARTEEVSFPASHTAAVHAAVLGTLRARHRVGRRVVTSAVEHSAVLNAARHAGEPVAVDVAANGRVHPDAFAGALAVPGTALACLQTANGEVGTLQPVAEVAERAATAGVPLLVDAAASTGHAPAPPAWDLLVADPRSWGGLPGAGVLAVRAGTRWLSPAAEDEGTEHTPGPADVPAVLAAAVALQQAESLREGAGRTDARRALVDRIRTAAAAVPDTEVVGDPVDRLPHVVTFSCLYVDGEALVGELDRAGLAVGSGSACTSATLAPSHVLEAMGVLTHGNVRVGLHHGTTVRDVDRLCTGLPGAVARVRALLGAEGL